MLGVVCVCDQVSVSLRRDLITNTPLCPFNSWLALRVDFLGLCKKDSLMRSTTCSETDGRPECPFL